MVQLAAVKPGRFRIIGEIFSELRKVVWPSRQEAYRLTVMVIAVSVAVGIILGILDLGFTEIVRFLLRR